MSENWQPYANSEAIKLRAKILACIRQFMARHEIMEVETPILSRAAVSDIHIDSFTTAYANPDKTASEALYLHTSPEYAMKRLLASGSGSIYQITKVFRDGEQGKQHNPEFTMLEWYQPGYDHHQLMDEICLLLKDLKLESCEKTEYETVFIEKTRLNPHTCELEELQQLAYECGLSSDIDDRSILLDFIFGNMIAPELGHDAPIFVYDYPACQSSLAKLNDSLPHKAERFELFVNGMEIANGFHELTDSEEQAARFAQDLNYRQREGRQKPPVDQLFLDALKSGLPDCSGVAVGIDRLLMVLANVTDIREVLSFPIDKT